MKKTIKDEENIKASTKKNGVEKKGKTDVTYKINNNKKVTHTKDIERVNKGSKQTTNAKMRNREIEMKKEYEKKNIHALGKQRRLLTD